MKIISEVFQRHIIIIMRYRSEYSTWINYTEDSQAQISFIHDNVLNFTGNHLYLLILLEKSLSKKCILKINN